MSDGFNQRIYGKNILAWIPDVNEHDLNFLSNKASELYKEVEDAGCVDNFRISRVVHGQVSDKYEKAVESGCCGSSDVHYTNELTGNTFSIGFNYGH